MYLEAAKNLKLGMCIDAIGRHPLKISSPKTWYFKILKNGRIMKQGREKDKTVYSAVSFLYLLKYKVFESEFLCARVSISSTHIPKFRIFLNL
jgi:hypothetical protein